MEFKGTKGRWEVELTTVQSKRRLIANCIGNGITFSEEDKYNAKLMSKAPEMLEKLQEIVENWKSGNEDNFIMANLIDDAEKIIHEATELKSE